MILAKLKTYNELIKMYQINEIQEDVLGMIGSVSRDGIPELIEYLQNSNFFSSPASTKYHGAYPGGLCSHSLNVADMFRARNLTLKNRLPEDSVVICGMLHDLCKVGYYVPNGDGWRTDKGHLANKLHGVLSVRIINQYIELTPIESAIIKFHMGLFSVYGYTKEYGAQDLHKAIILHPGVQIFAACDMEEANAKE